MGRWDSNLVQERSDRGDSGRSCSRSYINRREGVKIKRGRNFFVEVSPVVTQDITSNNRKKDSEIKILAVAREQLGLATRRFSPEYGSQHFVIKRLRMYEGICYELPVTY